MNRPTKAGFPTNSAEKPCTYSPPPHNPHEYSWGRNALKWYPMGCGKRAPKLSWNGSLFPCLRTRRGVERDVGRVEAVVHDGIITGEGHGQYIVPGCYNRGNGGFTTEPAHTGKVRTISTSPMGEDIFKHFFRILVKKNIIVIYFALAKITD
jgi:hypothetical protein